MRFISYIVILFLIILGLSFAVLNAQYVTLNYYIGKGEISLSLLLFFTLTLGISIGMIAYFKPWFILKRQNRALRLRIKTLEKEIDNLRTIPVRDHH